MTTFTDLTNEEFLERFAKPGCVGLAGGPSFVDKLIRRAQSRQRADRMRSLWGHAFFFQGRRADGRHWVIESDIDIHRRHIRLGVQENRITKYHDDEYYTSLAVLDFGLTEDQTHRLIAEGLDLIARNTQYSLREVFGAFLTLHEPRWRERPNLLKKERAMFCSAFVQHLFDRIGIDFAPNVHMKQSTPEDIFRTPVPHTRYQLIR